MSETKTVWVLEGEQYPTYTVADNDDYGIAVQVPAELLDQLAAAEAAYDDAQGKIGALYEAAKQAQREEAARQKAEREAAERAERERVEAERREAARLAQQRQAAAWAKVAESGGVVYDASGEPIGKLEKWKGEARLSPPA